MRYVNLLAVYSLRGGMLDNLIYPTSNISSSIKHPKLRSRNSDAAYHGGRRRD